ncbi:hypothetical protein [Flavobacterium sp.]|uniref:hypothetical protein n=1 Tax=Flavobacterium sp. TaxID=239 RepID=UPI00374CA375
MEKEIENELLKLVTNPRQHNLSFSELIENFELILEKYNPIEKSFEIKKYFDKDMGKSSATKK